MLFNGREIIYQAARHKELAFFMKISAFLKDGKSRRNQKHYIELDWWLVANWTTGGKLKAKAGVLSKAKRKLVFPPLCFFTPEALDQFWKLVTGNSFGREHVAYVIKGLGLKMFTEPWFHVYAVDEQGAKISEKRRGRAERKA